MVNGAVQPDGGVIVPPPLMMDSSMALALMTERAIRRTATIAILMMRSTNL